MFVINNPGTPAVQPPSPFNIPPGHVVNPPAPAPSPMAPAPTPVADIDPGMLMHLWQENGMPGNPPNGLMLHGQTTAGNQLQGTPQETADNVEFLMYRITEPRPDAAAVYAKAQALYARLAGPSATPVSSTVTTLDSAKLDTVATTVANLSTQVADISQRLTKLGI